MNENKVYGILLLIPGAALLFYGINHINSAVSQLRAAFGGGEDTTGYALAFTGGAMAVIGLFLLLRKPTGNDEALLNQPEDAPAQKNQGNTKTFKSDAHLQTETDDTRHLQQQSDFVLQLKQLKQLLDEDILTQEEYQQQKNKILNS